MDSILQSQYSLLVILIDNKNLLNFRNGTRKQTIYLSICRYDKNRTKKLLQETNETCIIVGDGLSENENKTAKDPFWEQLLEVTDKTTQNNTNR